jgi:hypothetical protein
MQANPRDRVRDKVVTPLVLAHFVHDDGALNFSFCGREVLQRRPARHPREHAAKEVS